MVPMTAVVGLIATSLAVATVSISDNSKAHPSRDHATIAANSAPAAKARVVHVSGEDFKFDAPDILPAGLTEFRFLNKGPSLHHMAVLRLTDGKTIDDLRALLAHSGPPSGPPPSWVKEMGGPNAPAPGAEANATMVLEPGNYALICFVDIGGPPHFTKGMVKGLRVVAAPGAVAPKPKADVTVDLLDYSFKLSSPVRAGKRTIRVHNVGKQHHEVELVQLAPGASVQDFMKWMGKMEVHRQEKHWAELRVSSRECPSFSVRTLPPVTTPSSAFYQTRKTASRTSCTEWFSRSA